MSHLPRYGANIYNKKNSRLFGNKIQAPAPGPAPSLWRHIRNYLKNLASDTRIRDDAIAEPGGMADRRRIAELRGSQARPASVAVSCSPSFGGGFRRLAR